MQIEAFENTQLLADGQLLLTKHLHLGSRSLPISQDELRTALAELRSDAIRALRRIGLDEGQLPDFGQVSEEVFSSQLLRLSGPVTVGLVASGPAFTAGPAQLEFVVLY